MKFEEITQTATVVFDMAGLHAMALLCKLAVESGEGGLQAEAFLAAFTAASMIAYTHADIGPAMEAHMAKVHARIEAGEGWGE